MRALHRKVTIVSRRFAVRRSLAAAALAPLALTSLAACGSDGKAADAGSSTSATSSDSPSAATTDAAPAEAPEEGSSVDPADFTALMSASFEKVTTAHATLTSEVMGGAMNGEGDVDYSSDPPVAAMTMTGDLFGDEDIESRIVEGILYLKLGSMTGGKFAKLDLSDPNNPLGGQFADSMDPKSALENLGDAIEKVTYVGEEDLAGGSARHYTAAVDTQKLLDGFGQDLPASGMPTSLAYEVWFDDQGRFEQLKVDLGNAGSSTTTLSDYGKDVSIQAPSSGEITEDSPFSPTPASPAA